MKTELTSLDLYFLTKELQTLVGSRVDKIYQPDGFLFQVHKTGLGKALLRVEKSTVWMTSTKTDAPETPSGLCGLLRKHLEGKKLVSLEQVNGERILKLTFKTTTDTYFLYIELFSNGNIVLCDGEGIVKAAQEERAWKDRAIKRGLPYKLPPAKKNFTTLTVSDLDTTEPIAKHLATLGLGKTYAEELCTRVRTNPLATKLPVPERQKLLDAFHTLIAEKPAPRAYSDGEITPFALFGKEGTPYETFSSAIDSNLSKSNALIKLERARAKYTSEKQRIQNAIDLQKKGLARVEEESAKHKRIGELIYEHHQEIKNIIEQINLAKKKHSLQEIALKLKGHAVVKHVNPKTHEITVEVQDE